MVTQVIAWHGEHRSVFYLIRIDVPEREMPEVLASFRCNQDAITARNLVNMVTAREPRKEG